MKKSIMKTNYFSLFIAFILLAGGVKAQSTENWSPVIINTDGSNITNGVQVSYVLSTSNNTILVQLVNRNPYPVKAAWKDLIITKNGQSLSNNKEETVIIASKVKLSDDAANTTQLTIKLSDFQTTAADFKNFSVSDFALVPVK